METTATPAAAPPTEKISAGWAAAAAGNVTEFQDAERAKREGKPLAAVERAKPDAKVDAAPRPAGKQGAPAKGPSAADREADARLTARIKEAVDTSTAELSRKNRELEAELSTHRASRSTAPASGPAPSTTPRPAQGPLTSADIKRYSDLSDAPRLDAKDAQGNFLYGTAHEHGVALSLFIQGKRSEESATAERDTATRDARAKQHVERVQGFAGRVEAYRQAHPDQLVDNGKGEKVALPLSQEVAGMYGFARLEQVNAERQHQGQPPLQATVDHAIAEEIYDSEVPVDVARYISDHPEALADLRQARDPRELAKRFDRLEQKVRSGAAPVTGATPPAPAQTKPSAADARRKAEAAVDRSVSSTRAEGTTLGRPGAAETDPEEVAVRTGDAGGFLETQRQKRQEELDRRLGRAKR